MVLLLAAAKEPRGVVEAGFCMPARERKMAGGLLALRGRTGMAGPSLLFWFRRLRTGRTPNTSSSSSEEDEDEDGSGIPSLRRAASLLGGKEGANLFPAFWLLGRNSHSRVV